MSKPRPVRIYRLPLRQRLAITLTLGMPGVAPVVGTVTEDDAPLVFRAGLLLLAGAGFLIIAGFWRMATIVRHDAIVVRQLLRTRTTAWSDVLALDIEAGLTPGRGLLLDRQGRRFALTGGIGPHVHEIREMWLRSRGERWTPPDPAFAAAADRRMRARGSALGWAVMASAGALVGLLLIGYTLSVGGWDGGGDFPWTLQLVGIVPVITFAVVYPVMLRARPEGPERREAAERGGQ